MFHFFFHAGFTDALQNSRSDIESPAEMSLVRLVAPCTLGAAFLGARAAGVILPMKFADNIEVFYRYKKH